MNSIIQLRDLASANNQTEFLQQIDEIERSCKITDLMESLNLATYDELSVFLNIQRNYKQWKENDPIINKIDLIFSRFLQNTPLFFKDDNSDDDSSCSSCSASSLNRFLDFLGICSENIDSISEKINKFDLDLEDLEAMLNEVPQNERYSLFKTFLSFCDNFEDTDFLVVHSYSILSLIMNFSEDKREEILTRIIHILKNIPNEFIKDFFESFERMKADEIIAILDQAKPVIDELKKEDIYSQSILMSLLKYQLRLPQEKWSQFKENARLLINEETPKNIRVNLMCLMMFFFPSETDLLKKVADLLMKDQTIDLFNNEIGGEGASLVESFNLIQEGNRVEVLKDLLSLIKLNDPTQLGMMAAVIEKMKVRNPDLFSNAIPFLKELGSNWSRATFLIILNTTDEEDYALLDLLKDQLDHKKFERQEEILKWISSLPSNERKGVLGMAAGLSRGFKIDASDFLDILLQIPSNEREMIIEKEKDLFKNLNQELIESFLQILKKTYYEKIGLIGELFQFLDFEPGKISNLADLFNKTILGSGVGSGLLDLVPELSLDCSEDLEEKNKMIKFLTDPPSNLPKNEIPPGDKLASLSLAIQISKPFKVKASDILQLLSLIPEEKRRLIIDSLIDLTREALTIQRVKKEFLNQGLDIERLLNALPLFNSVTSDKQAFVFKILTLVPNLKNLEISIVTITEKCANLEKLEWILSLLTFFPLTHRNMVILIISRMKIRIDEFPCNNFNDFIGKFIDSLLRLNPTWVKPTHIYLIQQLQTMTDRQNVHEMAKVIKVNHRAFQINSNHPLARQAEIQFTLSLETTNIKNPYNIYKKLQELSIISTPNSILSILDIGNQFVSLNPEGFRMRAAPPIKLTFRQLPALDIKFISNCFAGLDERAKNETSKDQIKSYLANGFETPYDKLKQNFLYDIYLNSLLSLKGEPDEETPLALAQLLAYLKYIQDQPNHLSSEQVLTPQEESLLKFSESIQQCPKGKGEAIALAYYQLPSKYRYTDESGPSILDRSFAYLNEMVQQVLNEVLSSESTLMRKLTKVNRPDTIKQLSHQSIYIKNLIGPRIGLKHILEFDPSTETLYDALLLENNHNDLQIILNKVYEYLTPEYFVDALKVRFSKEQNENKNLYFMLTEILTQTGSKVKLEDVWELGDDCVTYTLTDRGAVEILKAAGYFNNLSIEDVLFNT